MHTAPLRGGCERYKLSSTLKSVFIIRLVFLSPLNLSYLFQLFAFFLTEADE